MRFLFALLFALLPASAPADCVVLLHGLARTPSSLLVMEEALGQAGYRVVNQGSDTGVGFWYEAVYLSRDQFFDADEDTLAILKDEMEKGAFPGLIHCFSASEAFARDFADLFEFCEGL